MSYKEISSIFCLSGLILESKIYRIDQLRNMFPESIYSENTFVWVVLEPD